ncbi:hypothetical protein J3P84_09940 [Pseudomonas sp. Z1-29]|uniref:hypothetical protein n=1 Tax=Pseudomonas sp. Z1-29 TaxID=2817410 RepID=UPI003DA944D1
MSKEFESLGKFLVQLHARNSDRLQTVGSLKKYWGLRATPRTVGGFDFLFAGDHKVKLERDLADFLKNPRGLTPFYLLDADERKDWVTLIRLIAKDNNKINAEIVSLKQMAGEYKGFGYRYEHPENAGDKHNFFHIQPIRSTDCGAIIPGVENWLPVSYPAFFMMAASSFELILYSIHSLCGWKVVSEYMIRNKLNSAAVDMMLRTAV